MTPFPTTTSSLTHALGVALDWVREHRDAFGDDFPTSGYPLYQQAPNTHWMAGFWPGMLWLAYHATGDEALRRKAEALSPSFVARLDQRVNLIHDVGFLYLLSCRAQWMLTGEEHARVTALRAAEALAQRFNPKGGYIQAWGEIGDPAEAGRMIIDCMMNINLLYWASDQTGDARYQEMARRHAQASMTHLVRADGSTYHTFFFDPHTGDPIYAQTHQGFSDDSVWSRGQAWTIYGFALSAEWTGDEVFLHTAQKAADYFLTLSPSHRTPLWDFQLPPDAPQLWDSSAGAIAAAGLLRLARLTGRDAYRIQAETLLRALIRDCMEPDSDRPGLLRHSAQHVPHGHTPDGYTIFGDYFFLEALLTATDSPPDFWGKQDNKTKGR